MPSVQANGLTIEYEARGEGAPLLLIMGVGTQLIHWPCELVDLFVERGFRVIRFDNRDMGLSSKLTELGTPRLGPLVLRAALGLRVDSAYTLSDMAADAVGLLDALEVPAAHILGVSMGSMIAQLVAIEHPSHALSLTSIMSTTGDRYIGKLKAIRALLGKAEPTRESAVARSEKIFEALRGSRFPYDREGVRLLAGKAYDRCFCPDGFQRQMAAILAARPRTERLRELKVPTLVLHGTEDPLVPFAAGEAVARAVPGAKLEPIEGMGHELPRGAWPIIADAVARHAGVTAARSAPGST